MGDTSERMLELLSLLQRGLSWSGAELADRLDVSPRTVRRDMDRLRRLGYEVESSPGTGGSYRLLAGGRISPLLLSPEEAVAAAAGLRHAAAYEGEEAGAASTALGKLEQMLPSLPRRRIEAVAAATDAARRDERGGGDALETLGRLASAAHELSHVRFRYTGRGGQESERRVEPYRQVLLAHRWYLLGWDLDRGDWRSFRVDRVRDLHAPGTTFVPRAVPRRPAFPPRERQQPTPDAGSVRFDAPMAVVSPRLVAEAGTLEPVDETHCRYRTAPDDWDWLAAVVVAVSVPYTIEAPEALRRATRRLADRAQAAAIEEPTSPVRDPGGRLRDAC